MLINKALDKENKPISVTVQYNGKFITVEPGEKLDVRDFDVANKDVRGVEKHITIEHPGAFELSNEKADVAAKETMAENKELKKSIIEKDKKIAALQDAFDNVNEKHSSSSGEISAAKKEVTSMKKEVDRLAKVNKDLEDEVEKLRLQIATPTKAR